jgi:hypothetical protein
MSFIHAELALENNIGTKIHSYWTNRKCQEETSAICDIGTIIKK